jgi:hypothetical protein
MGDIAPKINLYSTLKNDGLIFVWNYFFIFANKMNAIKFIPFLSAKGYL